MPSQARVEKEGVIPDWLPLSIALVISIISILAGPLLPAPIIIPVVFFIAIALVISGITKEFRARDGIIVFFVFLMTSLLYAGFVGYSFITIPLWKLVVIAVVADIIAFGLGWLAAAGYAAGFIGGVIIDLFTAIIVFIGVSYFVGGGIQGVILGSLAAIGALIPGPIPVTTITFLALYFGMNWIGEKLSFLRFLI